MSLETESWNMAIHGENPWLGFQPDVDRDLQGWGSEDPIFAELVERVKPRHVLEIGSWKGASTVSICDSLVRAGLPETPVFCVDTWLGSREMVGIPSGDSTRGLHRVNGWPNVYRTFLVNLEDHGHAERVVPFPQTSQIALRWLYEAGARFDLIYVDASHDYQDVLDDCKAAWRLLRGPGSVMFGDDYDPIHWKDVILAVDRWSAAESVAPEIRGRFWVATKSETPSRPIDRA